MIETARIDGLEAGRSEGRAEGLSEGRAKGLAEGELKAKQTIAQGMLAKNLDLETIAELTGLTFEAVAQCRNND